ncbi:ATP-dependent RNA helicase RhlE [Labilithrix luteola]|uniref:DEAD-box ATP-dependent RNA helicase RhpA n=1 Tax=Labilithrix luteola TaxID=1391654 RepID=A0A0K1Q5S9_9BACT|nr:DEAD/DEAH box helicase [Labilithrix luteola]AKV00740.1 ATP-dependent RNA helicase RhlE [Labilithrix luteola]
MNSTATLPESPFAALGLLAPFVRAVAQEGYEAPTPIQSQAIPHVIQGRDLLGCAQTGTGKTAAFVLPILQRLAERPRNGKIRCLILAPTRELAAQIGERASAYGRHVGLRQTVIYGGVGQRNQEIALKQKPDILIATPGRLLDLIQQGFVSLDGVEIFVLDEADRMLDMGFIHDVRKVVKLVPTKRQTLFFSATMPRDIADLAQSILIDPVRVSVAPQSTTAEKVEQSVYFVAKSHKRALLEKLLRDQGALRTIVFTRTKHGANRLAEQLTRGGLDAAAIHGNKSQGARERALEGFKNGTISVLVATDLAARGIDVDGISHVVNFELPNVPEQYVHRIGRTGRAGAEGRAIAFCDEDEKKLLQDIERLIRTRIPVAGRVVMPASSADRTGDNDGRPPRAHGAHGNGQAQRGSQQRAPQQQRASQQPRVAQQPRAPQQRPQAPRPASVTTGPSAGNDPNSSPGPRRRRRRRFRGARLPQGELS